MTTPAHALSLFADLQVQRIRRELICATPAQTFTAQRRVEHGTVRAYVHLGCRCRACADANRARREDRA